MGSVEGSERLGLPEARRIVCAARRAVHQVW